MLKPILSAVGAVLLTTSLQASELVYRPVNPNFGGNPLNGSHLLANAQAQSKHKDPDAKRGLHNRSALDRFTDSLESRLLGQLLADVGTGNEGSLITEDFIVNIVDDSGFLQIEVTDRATNESTIIEVNGLIPD